MEYTALILFTLSTSITPGPNNVMIMASGANHGFRKSIPHLLGIDLGFPLMLMAVGLGAGQVFQQSPFLFSWLKVIGACYLTYLAIKIATAPTEELKAEKVKPMSFIQAVLFQWVNPKAWIMCIGAVVTYTVAEQSYSFQVICIAFLFFVFGTPCTITWLLFGASLKKKLSKPAYLKTFNIVMASLLMASLVPVFVEIYST